MYNYNMYDYIQNEKSRGIMKKKTLFYVFLAVWVVALATLAGVLISDALKKDDPTITDPPPSTEQTGGGSSGSGGSSSSEDDDDEKNWTANY